MKSHIISNDVRNAAARERSQLRRSIRRRRSNSQPRDVALILRGGTFHLRDSWAHQRHGGIVHPVLILPSQGREDSIIDFIPASFISSSDDDDDSTTKSVVHTFDGELFSTSSTSNNLHSKATILSTVTSTTSTLNTATIATEFGAVIQLVHHVNG